MYIQLFKQGYKVCYLYFWEIINGKVIEKGTLVKMARGEMVRFMAENKIHNIEDIKSFNRLGYVFKEGLSDENNYVFVKERVEKSRL